jgi:hypothetical protein
MIPVKVHVGHIEDEGDELSKELNGYMIAKLGTKMRDWKRG